MTEILAGDVTGEKFKNAGTFSSTTQPTVGQADGLGQGVSRGARDALGAADAISAPAAADGAAVPTGATALGALGAGAGPSAVTAEQPTGAEQGAAVGELAKPGATVSVTPDGGVTIDTGGIPGAPTAPGAQPAVEAPEAVTLPVEQTILNNPDFQEFTAQLEQARGIQAQQAMSDLANQVDASRRRLAATGGRGFSAAFASGQNALTRDQLRGMAEIQNSKQMAVADDIAQALFAERQFQREDTQFQQQFDEAQRQFNVSFDAQIDQFAAENNISQQQVDILRQDLDNQMARFNAGLGFDREQLAAQVNQWELDNTLRRDQLSAQVQQWTTLNDQQQQQITNELTGITGTLDLQNAQLTAQIDQWSQQYGLDRAQLRATIGQMAIQAGQQNRALSQQDIALAIEQQRADTVQQEVEGRLHLSQQELEQQADQFADQFGLDRAQVQAQIGQWTIQNSQNWAQINNQMDQFEQSVDLEQRALELQEQVAGFQATMNTLAFFATTVPEMAGHLIRGFVENLGGGILQFDPETGAQLQAAMPEIVGKFYVENYGDSFTDAQALRTALEGTIGTVTDVPVDGAGNPTFETPELYRQWVIDGLVQQWAAQTGNAATGGNGNGGAVDTQQFFSPASSLLTAAAGQAGTTAFLNDLESYIQNNRNQSIEGIANWIRGQLGADLRSGADVNAFAELVATQFPDLLAT